MVAALYRKMGVVLSRRKSLLSTNQLSIRRDEAEQFSNPHRTRFVPKMTFFRVARSSTAAHG
jgi:hypothetical protein